MKRYTIILVLVILVQMFAPSMATEAAEDTILSYQVPDMSDMSKWSGEDIIKEIDKEMAMLYSDCTPSYYYWNLSESSYAGDKAVGKIRYDWLIKDLKRYASKYKSPMLFSPILYDPYDDNSIGLDRDNQPARENDAIGVISREYSGLSKAKEVPVWGKDIHGRWYIDWNNDAAFWFEHGWSGYRLNGNGNGVYPKDRLVITYDKALGKLEDQRDSRFEYYSNKGFPYIRTIAGFPDKLLDRLIQRGLDEIWAGKRGENLDFRSMAHKNDHYNARAQKFIHYAGEKPVDGTWVDKVLVMIPPTFISWGYGIRFCVDPGLPDDIYTLEVPIAPINMALDDLSVRLVDPPNNAAPENEVTIKAEIDSFFAAERSVDYKWYIPGVDDVVYQCSANDRDYQNGAQNGSINIPKMGAAYATATFTMPENGIVVGFEINPADASGKRPIEENGDYDDNLVMHYIMSTQPQATISVNIPAYVLSKQVDYRLGSAANLTQNPPVGAWDGNATGGLAVDHVPYGDDTKTVYREFSISDNPAVDEPSWVVSRSPRITGRVVRSDFGDDPEKKTYAPNKRISRTSLVVGEGSISRNYQYISYYPDAEGELQPYVVNGTMTAPFASIYDTRKYTFDVYNGVEELPFTKQFVTESKDPVFKDDALKYEFSWEGTPVEFDVVRWMCHMDANGNEYGWTSVDGQYKRTFVGQSTGSMTWETATSQANAYREDRDNARSGKTGERNYVNGVFATDKDMQGIAYPIKSGYYLNPAGEYKCTVKTTQYKDTEDATDEHQQFVDDVTAAFRYSSELQYVTSSRGTTKLIDVSEGNDRAVLKISSVTEKKTTKLATTKEREGDVDKLLMEVMEGYAASKSGEVYDKYGYQERTDKEIFLVEEETVITFRLAPPANTKLYTHVNMPNGNYRIRIWSEPFSFEVPSDKEPEEKEHIDIMTTGTMDALVLTVRGSMYDDR